MLTLKSSSALARNLILVVFVFNLNANFFGQQARKDSLESALKTTLSDTSRVKMLHQLGSIAVNDSEIMYYAEKTLILAEKLCESKDPAEVRVGKKNKANAIHDIGFVYVNQGEVEKGLGYLKKSLKIWEEINDKWGLAMTVGNIGYVYHNQGVLEKALEYYFRSLKLREEISDKGGMSYNLNNIGFIYYSLKQPEKTIDYYLRSLKISEEVGDKLGIASSLNNIGFVYRERISSMRNKDSINKQLELALNYYSRSLKLREESGDKKAIANSLSNIGYIYQKRSEINENADSAASLKVKALDYFIRSLKIREEVSDKKGISNSLNTVGMIYLKEGKTDLAQTYCERSLKLAQEIGFPAYVKDASAALCTIYKKQKKYEQALEMHVLFKQMSDSINSQENHKTILKNQLQYEFEKKMEASEALQEKKDAIDEEEKQKQAVIRNSFIAGFILVFISALLILRGYRHKQKANLIILKQKEEVEKAKGIIEMQKAMVEEKQKEIVDSIYYARRIQTALITGEKYIERTLKRLIDK